MVWMPSGHPASVLQDEASVKNLSHENNICFNTLQTFFDVTSREQLSLKSYLNLQSILFLLEDIYLLMELRAVCQLRCHKEVLW